MAARQFSRVIGAPACRPAALLAGSVLACVAAAAEGTAPSTAVALEEVVVTATKRPERLQDVPIAITALTEEELRRRGADRIEEYVAAVPGLSYASNGGNSGVLAIRGVATSTLAGNTQSPVALFYDDAPMLDSFAPLGIPDLQLFDVERVEVLRGPQGTLFGSGALGGAIRVQTRSPDPTRFEGGAQLHMRHVDDGALSYGASAAVNIPLVTDKLAIRLVGNYRLDGGYVDAARLGRAQANESRSAGGRMRLRWLPTERLTLDAIVNVQDDDPEDGAYVDYNGRKLTGNAFAPQPVTNDTKLYQLAVSYDFGAVTLTSLSNYADRTTVVYRDFTSIILGALGPLGVSGPSPVSSTGPSKILSQEFRLASDDEGSVRWLVGLFYLDGERGSEERLPNVGAGAVLAPFGFPSDLLYTGSAIIASEEKALFGEISWDFAPRWTATLGLRSFENETRFNGTADGIVNGGFTQTIRVTTENATTPKVALAFKPTESINFYAQGAKGYRVGQNNLGPVADPTSGLPIPANFGPDSLWNYEVGMKASFLQKRLFVDTSVYWIDWDDIQLQASSASGFNYVDNVGKARSRGVELQLRALPSENLEFGLAASFNDSEITDAAANAAAVRGDRLPGAAKSAFSEYVSWKFAPAFDGYLRVEHQYAGRAFSDLNNATALTFGDYHRFNVRLGGVWNRVEWMLSVNNLTNEDAYQSAVRLPIGPSAVPLVPRSVGFSVRTEF
jgi:iron complex outermembrane receptor protein